MPFLVCGADSRSSSPLFFQVRNQNLWPLIAAQLSGTNQGDNLARSSSDVANQLAGVFQTFLSRLEEAWKIAIAKQRQNLQESPQLQQLHHLQAQQQQLAQQQQQQQQQQNQLNNRSNSLNEFTPQVIERLAGLTTAQRVAMNLPPEVNRMVDALRGNPSFSPSGGPNASLRSSSTGSVPPNPQALATQQWALQQQQQQQRSLSQSSASGQGSSLNASGAAGRPMPSGAQIDDARRFVMMAEAQAMEKYCESAIQLCNFFVRVR